MQQQCLTAKAPDAFVAVTEARGGFAYKNPLPGDGPTAGSIGVPSLAPNFPAPSTAVPPASAAPPPVAALPPSADVIGSIPSIGTAPSGAPAEPAPGPIGTVIAFPLGFGFPSSDDADGGLDDAAAVEEADLAAQAGLTDNPQLAPQDLQSFAHSVTPGHGVSAPWACIGLAAAVIVFAR